MKVELTYFKRSGKYYANAAHDVPLVENAPLYRYWEYINDLRAGGHAPGLCGGGREFVVLVSVPEHPHDHPTLLMPLV